MNTSSPPLPHCPLRRGCEEPPGREEELLGVKESPSMQVSKVPTKKRRRVVRARRKKKKAETSVPIVPLPPSPLVQSSLSCAIASPKRVASQPSLYLGALRTQCAQKQCVSKKKKTETSVPIVPLPPSPLVQSSLSHAIASPKRVTSQPSLSLAALRIQCAQKQYVSMDCEMVGVGPFGKQSVLARVSLVDYHGTAMLDTFVRVDEPVTDYRTFVSGVRPENLESERAIDFWVCRNIVRQMIRNKILVGHGLENDLKALRFTHPLSLIRDTATYEPLMKCVGFCGGLQARKLRDLAQEKVGILIQQGGQEHDSLEDARAAMEVFKMVQHEWDMGAVQHPRYAR